MLLEDVESVNVLISTVISSRSWTSVICCKITLAKNRCLLKLSADGDRFSSELVFEFFRSITCYMMFQDE
ncbi:hypothetical protein HAX54_037553 [Datura stramonium]|uniref:Uncharacterized protein n=1 Tax=Datura stramonium TaxID=4076 RepID=A0ABS8SH25_DATST|nr:hypothetical protein [Datura stramonium]